MSKKVLIVEDNEENREVFRIILNHLNVEVREAKDGFEAISYLNQENFDLVLMDIQLPGKSGIEVLREMKQNPNLCDIPTIAVTAYAMKGDKDEIMEAGFDEYTSKPFNLANFQSILKKYLKQNGD